MAVVREVRRVPGDRSEPVFRSVGDIPQSRKLDSCDFFRSAS